MSIDDPDAKALVLALERDVRACNLCTGLLPGQPEPVLQLGWQAPILIAGQAPGRRAEQAGKPFADPSGVRLRQWLGVSEDCFYNPRCFSILPMGFCFPGQSRQGDAPPRPECAARWRSRLLAQHTNVRLTLVLGRYAQAWHLPAAPDTVTACVQAWQTYWPAQLALPHPSPRNRRWFANNPWFERELIPRLQARVKQLLDIT